MTAYAPINRNTTEHTTTSKATTGSGLPYFGWLFLFTFSGTTQTTYIDPNRNVTIYSTVNRN